jgi:hypothetical protein
MRTSNRLLIGFFAAMFIGQLATVITLRNKVGTSNFTIVRNDSGKKFTVPNSIPTPFKVIKVVSTEGQFNCEIRQDATPSYELVGTDLRDSTEVIVFGDTLFVTRIPRKDHTRIGNDYSVDQKELWVILKVPVIEQLEIVGGSITIPALQGFTNSNINARCFAGGKLSFNSTGTADTILTRKIHVELHSAVLAISDSTKLAKLDITTLGYSSINIAPTVSIQEISARISDSTIVNAGWGITRKLLNTVNH